MAFRDHLSGAIEIDSISPIFAMKNEISNNPNTPILFKQVEGSIGHSAAANVCIRSNMARHFGIKENKLMRHLAWAMDNPSKPVEVSNNIPVFENSINPPDLTKLPIPHHYEEDRGRYMSASIIIAESNGRRNVSFHRQYIRDPTHIVARMVPRHLRTMTDEARAKGESVNIAIINGADPTLLLAAAMSFSEPIDELTMAAALHEKFYSKPMEVTKLQNGVTVPVDAEYVIEAVITCDDDDEGPYIDITGTIDHVRQEPVIEVSAIHHRTNPIFHALLPGLSEHHALMGLPRAPTIYTAVSKVCECTDVVMTSGGSGWLSAVVQIVPKSPNDAKDAIMAAFNGHPSMKYVTVVDSDIDASDPVRVEWAMMTRWQPDKDTITLSGQKGSSLDPTRGADGLTSKMGIDATIPYGRDSQEFESVL